MNSFLQPTNPSNAFAGVMRLATPSRGVANRASAGSLLPWQVESKIDPALKLICDDRVAPEELLDIIEAHFQSLSPSERVEYGRTLLAITHVAIEEPAQAAAHTRTREHPRAVYLVPGPASLDLNLRLDQVPGGLQIGEVSVTGGGVALKAQVAAQFGIEPVFLMLGKGHVEAQTFRTWANSIGGFAHATDGPARTVPHISVKLSNGDVLGPAILVPELELTEQDTRCTGDCAMSFPHTTTMR